jgi:hypothetical protein
MKIEIDEEQKEKLLEEIGKLLKYFEEDVGVYLGAYVSFPAKRDLNGLMTEDFEWGGVQFYPLEGVRVHLEEIKHDEQV